MLTTWLCIDRLHTAVHIVWLDVSSSSSAVPAVYNVKLYASVKTIFTGKIIKSIIYYRVVSRRIFIIYSVSSFETIINNNDMCDEWEREAMAKNWNKFEFENETNRN